MSFASFFKIACEQQTHFRSSLLPLFFVGRQATTGNASAVLFYEGSNQNVFSNFFWGVGGCFFCRPKLNDLLYRILQLVKFLPYDISEDLKKFASFGRSLPRRNSYKEYLGAHPMFVVAYPDSQTSEVVRGPFGERRVDRQLHRTAVNQVSTRRE